MRNLRLKRFIGFDQSQPNTQQNIQHNDTQHKGLFLALSIHCAQHNNTTIMLSVTF